jgi:hypothetical protein
MRNSPSQSTSPMHLIDSVGVRVIRVRTRLSSLLLCIHASLHRGEVNENKNIRPNVIHSILIFNLRLINSTGEIRSNIYIKRRLIEQQDRGISSFTFKKRRQRNTRTSFGEWGSCIYELSFRTNFSIMLQGVEFLEWVSGKFPSRAWPPARKH